MKPKQDAKVEADQLVRDIKRATRQTFSAEEKIRIVLEGLLRVDGLLPHFFEPEFRNIRYT